MTVSRINHNKRDSLGPCDGWSGFRVDLKHCKYCKEEGKSKTWKRPFFSWKILISPAFKLKKCPFFARFFLKISPFEEFSTLATIIAPTHPVCPTMLLPLPCSWPQLPRVPGELMDRVRRRAARVEAGGEEVVGEHTLARLHKQVT